MPTYQLNNGAVIQRQSKEPDRYVLSFRSQLDTITVGELENRCDEIIRDETVGTVVFYLSQTAFLDASGLRCILVAQLHANEADKHLRLCRCLSEPVARLFEIVGLTEYFTYEETIQ